MNTRNWPDLISLLEPCHARAAALARRLAGSPPDGDDLLQEAVLRALEKLPGLRQRDRFWPWFCRILVSVQRNRSRSAFWRRFLPLPEGEARGEREPVGEDGGRWEELRVRSRRLREALGRLPGVQREAVVLFELEGFAIEEIAFIQSASIPAVKSRLARGRERLRRHYQRLGEGDLGPPLELQSEGDPS